MLKWGAASGVIHTNYFRLLKPLSWLSDYSPCTPLKSKKKNQPKHPQKDREQFKCFDVTNARLQNT